MSRKKKTQNRNEFKFDDINFYILKELSKNGRTRYSKLARELGLTHVSIKNRYEELEKKGFIKPTIEVNYTKLGLKIGLLLLEVESQGLDEITQIYKSCPRIIYYFPLIGQYNLGALFYAENDKTYETILHSCMLYCLKGIRKSNILTIGGVMKDIFFPFRFGEISNLNDTAPCGINCKKCDKLTSNLCLGCPSTSEYKGPFKIQK
ncbi:MAG: winged helix-turn-helix transcriptional regulator [Promethearchaeota archaeon]